MAELERKVIPEEGARAAYQELKERRVWPDCRGRVDSREKGEAMDHQAVQEIAEKTDFQGCLEELDQRVYQDSLVLTVSQD